jgi:hypothetical protein
LLAIVGGGGVRLGRPEIVVVVDHTQPHPDGTPAIDWGQPVEIPARVLDTLARRAVTHTVVVRDGVIVSEVSDGLCKRSGRDPIGEH